jgi:hypothetical protein
MTLPCDHLRDQLPEIVQDAEALPPELEAHARACLPCASLLRDADELRGALGESIGPPPLGLAQRTLDRCLSPQPIGPANADLSSDSSETDRLTAALVYAAGLSRSGEASRKTPNRRELIGHIARQSAAACLLFALCGGFWSVFLPAYTEARENSHSARCQSKLAKLSRAAAELRRRLPNSVGLQGLALRNLLIGHGLAIPTDFQCPGSPYKGPQDSHYFGSLPAPGDTRLQPLFWDKFNNHIDCVHVALSDGRVRRLTSGELSEFMLKGLEGPPR